ncbi:MAG: OpgC domain-containing protein [Candidatus Binatia bacterium]
MDGQRDFRVDTLRGLLLVMIAINHFGMSLSEEWWVIRSAS